MTDKNEATGKNEAKAREQAIRAAVNPEFNENALPPIPAKPKAQTADVKKKKTPQDKIDANGGSNKPF